MKILKELSLEDYMGKLRYISRDTGEPYFDSLEDALDYYRIQQKFIFFELHTVPITPNFQGVYAKIYLIFERE